MARKVKSLEQIETEILMEYLASDEDIEALKQKRLRRLGRIDENGEPEERHDR